MKAWRKLFAAALVIIVLIFIGGNAALSYLLTPERGRPYRVEINRLTLLIEENGLDGIDLSQCQYVYNIERQGENFYRTDSDYQIKEINGVLYRFDYSVKRDGVLRPAYIVINSALGAMSAAVIGILIYIRKKILTPFERISTLPYDLSKGNLTAPIPENKSRFFGKFLWGINLLRENTEQQRQRELELQKEKKTLLLSLSHDIKTPLSAIKLYSKALSKNLYPDREKQREIIDSISDKADEIEGYIAGIITASKEDFLSLEVKNGEFYLSDLLDTVVGYYKEKTALVRTEFIVNEYKNKLLYGDLDRSVEVFQNIMENALKYGDGKKIELIFPKEDDGVLISVRNSGCTLDPKELPHIFESFWRGSNSGNISGSGLGLYICRQLMIKMKGEIFAEVEGDFVTVTVVFNTKPF